jgi:8-oxo-dGTP diphosphatase
VHDPDPVGSAAIGAACALFDSAGRVLLVRHTYGKLNWEIPGGACLPTEAPLDGALRELQEETGLNLRADAALSGVYFEPGHDFGPVLHFVFRFQLYSTQRPVARPPEIGAVGWFELNALPVPMSDFTEQRIADALGAVTAYRLVTGRAWRD